LEKNSIIIFTSPSTIKCFFKSFDWDSSFKAVVIGNSTKKHLPQDIECYESDSLSINGCIDKAKEISLLSNLK
jgi:uroporphyrinogen-III synthase